MVKAPVGAAAVTPTFIGLALTSSAVTPCFGTDPTIPAWLPTDARLFDKPPSISPDSAVYEPLVLPRKKVSPEDGK